MQLNRRQERILYLVLTEPGTPAEELSQKAGITTRTLSADMENINTAIASMGLKLENRRGSGLYCGYENAADFSYLKQQLVYRHYYTSGEENEFTERVGTILRLLLLENGYIKTEDLAERLWLARSSFQAELREVGRLLARYGLELEKRPHYGIAVKGPEAALRQCMVDHCKPCFHAIDALPFLEDGYSHWGLDHGLAKKMHQVMTSTFHAQDFHASDQALQRLIVLALLMGRRISAGCVVELDKKLGEAAAQCPTYPIAKAVLEHFYSGVPPAEVAYLALMLAANADTYHSGSLTDYDIFYLQAAKLCDKLQAFFRDELYIVFSADPQFQSVLTGLLLQYVIREGLGVREYGYTGPLYELALRLPASRQLACLTAAKLTALGGPPADQYFLISFTMLFYNTVMSIPSNRQRLRMLCVGPGSQFTARSIDYKIRAQHHHYIDSIDYCEAYELSYMDLRKYDCLITTEPPEMLPERNTLPTMQLRYFMNWRDLYDFRNRIVLPQLSMETLVSKAARVGFQRVEGLKSLDEFILWGAQQAGIPEPEAQRLVAYNELLPILPQDGSVALLCHFVPPGHKNSTQLFSFDKSIEIGGRSIRSAIICTICLNYDTQVLKSADSLLRRVLLDENEIIALPDEFEG